MNRSHNNKRAATFGRYDPRTGGMIVGTGLLAGYWLPGHHFPMSTVVRDEDYFRRVAGIVRSGVAHSFDFEAFIRTLDEMRTIFDR